MSKYSKEDLDKIRVKATLEGKLDKYVWLREDHEGRYLEYAFIEGCPHDNRCLSWYDKEHVEYKKTHPGSLDFGVRDVDELYELGQFSCGNNDLPEEDPRHCSPGHPSRMCEFAKCHWTYDEPRKCACWFTHRFNVPESVVVPIDLAIKWSRMDTTEENAKTGGLLETKLKEEESNGEK